MSGELQALEQPSRIHPTAIVHPKAHVHSSVRIGPYAVIDGDVEIDADCVIGPHAYLTGHTKIGRKNRFHASCVIGDEPQDHKYRGEPTKLRIGDENVFREHVTVHRSNKLEEDTVIGSHNLLMAGSHVGHNVVIGDHVILANAALLAGHVNVADRVFISGSCLVHQFVRIGPYAMMQGGAGISKDLPPYAIAAGENEICGLNVVGLRRNGFSAEARLELRELYRKLFRSGVPLGKALAEVLAEPHGPEARLFLDFIRTSKRGVCSHGRRAEVADAE